MAAVFRPDDERDECDCCGVFGPVAYFEREDQARFWLCRPCFEQASAAQAARQAQRQPGGAAYTRAYGVFQGPHFFGKTYDTSEEFPAVRH